MSTIADFVVAAKNPATMRSAVKAAGVGMPLKEKGPCTELALTKLGFGKLAAGEIAELLKPENKIKLTARVQCRDNNAAAGVGYLLDKSIPVHQVI